MINRTKVYNNRVRHQLVLCVSSTDPFMVDKLQELLGGSINSAREFPHGGRSRPIRRWTVGSARAYEIIKYLHPHMVVKRDRAELAVDFYEKCVSQNKYTEINKDAKGRIVGRKGLDLDDIIQRDAYHSAMKALNQRGILNENQTHIAQFVTSGGD